MKRDIANKGSKMSLVYIMRSIAVCSTPFITHLFTYLHVAFVAKIYKKKCLVIFLLCSWNVTGIEYIQKIPYMLFSEYFCYYSRMPYGAIGNNKSE